MNRTPKRRWFRFSLPTFLAVVAVAGGWLGWNIRLANQRERMLAAPGVSVFDEIDPLNPMPLGLRLVRARCVPEIFLDDDVYSEVDVRRFQSYFPEAGVGLSASEGGVRELRFDENEWSGFHISDRPATGEQDSSDPTQ
jgi:hypothetical protein